MRGWTAGAAAIAIALGACRHGHPIAGTAECGSSGFAWVADSAPGGTGGAPSVIQPTIDVPEAGTAPWEFLSLAPNLVRLSDGRLVAGDLDASELAVFDSAGKRIGTWGRRGAGPGEFRGLAAIGPAGGDSVWAYDVRSLRVTVFDRAGHAAWSAPLDFPGAGAFALVLGRVGDGRFVVAETTAPGWTPHPPGSVGTDSTRLHLHRPGSGTSETLGWFRTFDVYVSKGGMRDLTGAAPFGRVAALVVTDSGLFYGFPDKAEIWFHPVGGSPRRVLVADAEGGAISGADVARY